MCGRWVPIVIESAPGGQPNHFTVHYSIEHAAIGCAGLTDDFNQEMYGLAILLSARPRPGASLGPPPDLSIPE
jgi:hypothetical protein